MKKLLVLMVIAIVAFTIPSLVRAQDVLPAKGQTDIILDSAATDVSARVHVFLENITPYRNSDSLVMVSVYWWIEKTTNTNPKYVGAYYGLLTDKIISIEGGLAKREVHILDRNPGNNFGTIPFIVNINHPEKRLLVVFSAMRNTFHIRQFFWVDVVKKTIITSQPKALLAATN